MHVCVHTSFYNGRLVAGANREHLEHSACGPQQLLIGEGPHDVDQSLGASTGQDDQLEQTHRLSGFFLTTTEAQVMLNCGQLGCVLHRTYMENF